MAIDLIIFDLDGTLIDSKVDIANALNHVLSVHKYPTVSVDATVGFIGDGVVRLIEKAVGREGLENALEMKEQLMDYYNKHAVDFTRPYDGVIETLKGLDGYKKAVVTNKPETLAKEILQVLDMDAFFGLTMGPESVSKKKPSPEPLLKAMTILESKNKSTLMVGDSANDIISGKSAQVSTVAVTYGYGTRDTISDADFIIDDFKDLPNVLEAL